MCGIWKKAKLELIKQSKLNKITTTTEIKWQRLRKERCKHKNNKAMCYWRGNRSPRRKTSSLPSKQSIIHQRIKLRYINSRRPSKPNLLSVPKPSKLLVPTRLRQTFVFSSLPDSFLITSQAPNSLLTDMSMVRKSFG